jgi:subtilisin family serine protease
MRIFLTIALLFSLLAAKAERFIVLLEPGITPSELLSVSGVESQLKAVKKLGMSWNIWLVETDLSLNALQALEEVVLAQEDHRISPRAIPNDPQFLNQWHLRNDGTNGNISGADIDAINAWDQATGGVTLNGDTIVVAVIDLGFDITHEDLNFFVNRAEIPGNSLDDDGNLYIDDHIGWDVYDGDGVLPISDHGTHVSGIIGAKGDNSVGVSGINWNVKVLPIAGASNLESDVIGAYGYVFDMRKLYETSGGSKGAYITVANSSFGVDFGDPLNFPIWCALYDSLGQIGILSVGAGPNAAVNVDQVGDIPSTCPSEYLIAVTNTNSGDSLAPSSGVGNVHMDLGAPGTEILSTVPSNGYASAGWTGSSMSAPMVSGAAALMMSAANADYLALYQSDPGQAIKEIRDMILNTVELLPTLDTTTSSGGRLDLFAAVQAMQLYSGVTSTSFRSFKISPTLVHDKFYVDSSERGIEIEIFDLLGRRMNFSRAESLVDVSHLDPGLYFVHAAKMGQKLTAKFVKL